MRGRTAAAQDLGASSTAQPEVREVRVCTSKVCKKQGAEQVLRFGQDLGLRGVEITAGGCLGNCGSGPNLVVLPDEIVLRHVSTPADLTQALRAFCDADVGEEVGRYEAALEASPSAGSAYMVHSNLSAAYMHMRRHQDALAAARRAVEGAPRGFHKAHVRLIDALYALGRFSEADAALGAAVALDPSFTRQPEYKLIVAALKGAKRSARA
ncbi:hypothetical protein MNEG_10572 [Monoraphidium neglectum]|uniref:Uncharacterized protein n=1 Tax=Monoraphidium neglectum TaxID=145388 RepID=A0A0D2M130_9CHLO|nr:hypothetical protein MNEG_10572 [Monoraphidium neglectum]KIY97389.1 hypothetical protein MNEG_10572 [Monoraphidium neglectum]|eukprot:XP_013896409.1 hypothetical protein MNEG_10572 [Monoraphidium neglectum]